MPGCDGPETSTTETVTITVNPVNDTPVALDASRTTDEDTPLTSPGIAGSDVETADADLTYSVTQPAHGTVTATTYTPAAELQRPRQPHLPASPTAATPTTAAPPDPACDAPETSTTETVSITVGPVNDAPDADAKTVTGVAEETSKSIGLSGSDVEGDALTFAVVDAPQHGSLDTTAPAATCAGYAVRLHGDRRLHARAEFQRERQLHLPRRRRRGQLRPRDGLDHRRSRQRHAAGLADERDDRRGRGEGRWT